LSESYKSIASIWPSDNFNENALAAYMQQMAQNAVYRRFAEAIQERQKQPTQYTEIPFLPINFFKSDKVLCDGLSYATIFESSGTTGSENSKHYVHDLTLYEAVFEHIFHQYYGNIKDWCILALLPSYLERSNSSLVYMAKCLIERSENAASAFYLDQWDALKSAVEAQQAKGTPTLLLGVSFALWEMAERIPGNYSNICFMETGGMKGRRREITREELHGILTNAFSVKHIHSEYGMTELMSQAYSKGNGIFTPPPWMRILIGDPYDPFAWKKEGETGIIHVIDLANKYSCPFIRTADLGKVFADGSFEVLGRADNSEIRGCNLML
jgi:hypothetical protein